MKTSASKSSPAAIPHLLSGVILLLLTKTSLATTLLFDDFTGSTLDESTWYLPQGAGTFFGRTQIKPPAYGGVDLRPVVAGSRVTLQLDTHNASALTAGDSFWGHEIRTQQAFTVGNGISIQARLRYVGTPPRGIVAGFFSYGAGGGPNPDEVDFELLGNDLGSSRILTNLFDSENPSESGDVAHLTVPGLDLAAWNVYEIRWLPDRVQWLINGTLIRERAGAVPNEPSEVRLNLWAPGPAFAIAYDSALQPAATPAANQAYRVEIDYVHVETAADTDGDGVPDPGDNCSLVPNPAQCDSDGDGYGNHCDGDLNNNGLTNAQDYILFRGQLGQPSVNPTYNQADLNCNGAVNSQDYVSFRGLLSSPPGPSGLVP
ncbi:MAG: family 16 glycosylhydrolase [Gammaproteobacteria bacterium]